MARENGDTSTSAARPLPSLKPSILDQAKLRRQEREANKQRNDAALEMQRVWRGAQGRKTMRQTLRTEVEVWRLEQLQESSMDVDSDAGGKNLKILRSVVFARDEECLAIWSEAVKDGAALIAQVDGPDGESSLALLRQVSLLLLKSVAKNPQSPAAPSHLKILGTFLTDRNVAHSTAAYLLPRGFYALLSQAIRAIPVASKSSPALPSLVALAVAPLSILPADALVGDVLSHILTIPLLPNRLPLKTLTSLSAKLPLGSLPATVPEALESLDLEARAHLLANLAAFAPPRYPKFSAGQWKAYLALLSALLSAVPPGALSPRPINAPASSAAVDSDSDDEMNGVRVAVVSSFASASNAPAKLPSLDPKTLTRLGTLVGAGHVKALLGSPAGARLELFRAVLGLGRVFASEHDRILTAVGAHAGGGLVRELYRGYARPSGIGKSAEGVAAEDGAWAAVLLLVDVYERALRVMGDDEFFGRGNVLTLDEVAGLSRQLLHVAYALYWRPENVKGGVEGMSWEEVRARATRCVVGIYGRDARRPFTPPGHWILIPPSDVAPFVEAALLDAQSLDDSMNTLSARLTRQEKLRRATLLSPRLAVLENIPFAVPFDTRVSIFRNFVQEDMRGVYMRGAAARRAQRAIGAWPPAMANPAVAAIVDGFRGRNSDNEDDDGVEVIGDDDDDEFGGAPVHDRGAAGPSGAGAAPGNRGVEIGPGGMQRAVVRRGQIAKDGFDRLYNADLKRPIQITFIDQWGQEEAGIDGGGVFKEFFTSLCQEVFDTDRGLWLVNSENELYPNPHSYAKEVHSLNWYRFIGRILGKAMYDGILVDVAFAPFFLAKWLGKQSFLDDLKTLDPELYQGLVFLKNSEQDPEELSLNFTVAVEDLGVTKTIDLVRNGSNTPVTRENKLQYITLVSHFKLNWQIKKQSEAFFEGLSEMIDPKWLRMFSTQEVQVLIGGVNSPINVDDLEQNTVYGGLFDTGHDTVRAFWNVVRSFGHDERRHLLRFVTSCSRPPLLGFKELNPKFAIRDAGGDESRLPTSSTCVNLLKLPRYSNEATLRAKLIQAINSNAGFDLS